MSQINRLQTIDADTLQSTAYEPVSFVVDDLLPQGLHLLAGAPKIGKSWLALWLCLCAAQGKPLWTFATRPCEVLYLCLEDSFQRICRNAVKVTDEEIFVKEPKTRAGDRYVYFSAEMESLLREYQKECRYITETYDQRQLTADDFLFRRQGAQLPMTPTTFTYRFKLILKKNGLPQELNVHSLRHTAASLMIAGGADVATVAGILGHSQPSTTLDIYTHAFDKNKKAASAGLQGMLEI